MRGSRVGCVQFGLCRFVTSALYPLWGEVTPGAGQVALIGTRDWSTQEGNIWRDLGSGTEFPVQEGLGRVPATSAGAQAGCSCILDKWGIGRRKACGLPPQEFCVQLVSSKVEGMGQGWQEEKALCRESCCSNGLLGSSVMFTKHWAPLHTCEIWSGFSDSSTSCYYPSI